MHPSYTGDAKNGNYNDAMMQKVAQAGNGMAAYVDTLNEARKLLSDDLSGSLFTIAKDMKIQVEFNPAAVSEYRLIGYETRMLNEADFNNDEVELASTTVDEVELASTTIDDIELAVKIFVKDLKGKVEKEKGKHHNFFASQHAVQHIS